MSTPTTTAKSTKATVIIGNSNVYTNNDNKVNKGNSHHR